ncbi:MAG TPA: hypothetical protein VG675_25605 [Bryobacteraceae bacterium]|nr:hypothetical protein [Bryobacteraceae bacterium]
MHEVEYIAPRTRSGERVYLTGYLFERKGSTLDWRGAFNRFQIGGERSYGWGRVRPFSITPTPGALFGIYPAYTNAERPIIEVFGGQALAAHALASDSDDHPGAIEPLVGRETNPAKAAFGVLPSVAAVCWAPGTRIAQNQRYRITAHGIVGAK